MSRYNTEQKRKILDIFELYKDKSFTGDEISSLLPTVGKSTVYRVLLEMDEEGILSSYEISKKRYFYLHPESCSSHLHIFCPSCGRIKHISNEAARRIRDILKEEMGVEADDIRMTMFLECGNHEEVR